jgi:acetyltransferase-like isoleucine patch superfamily enzyme
MIINSFKAIRKLKTLLISPIYTPVAILIFHLNGAIVKRGLRVLGFLKIEVTRRGKLKIGENLSLNSGNHYNLIGRQQKCIFWVEGELEIGNNVGMSATAIICNYKISIGNNVTIGGNTVIYDTDFHNLDPLIRSNPKLDKQSATKATVIIGNNVFIGAHSTILKGVTIGENSVVGACSLVSNNIPSNQIWAGNPAKFLKEIKFEK